MVVSVGDFSLYGLLVRIEGDEKGYAPPSGEPSAEDVKKALMQALPQVTALPDYAKAKAEAFLEPKLQAAGKEDGPAADKKRKALSDLLDKVRKAGKCDGPPHVQSAKKASAAAQKAFQPALAAYGKWERGKTMFKNVDDLNAMKREYEGAKALCDQADELLERYRQRVTVDTSELAKLAKAKPVAKPAGKTLAKPSPKTVPKPPPASAVRAAETVSALREQRQEFKPAPRVLKVENPTAEELGIKFSAWEKAPQAKKASPALRPAAKKAPAKPSVVLSFGCTVAAMAEHLQSAENEVRAHAESTAELKKMVTADVWEQIEQRSVQIEKQRIQAARDAEKQKAARMIAKVTKESHPVQMSDFARKPAPSAPAAAKKPPTLSKAAPIKTSANAFAALAGNDGDDDGFAVVKGKKKR
jgi:hypothetical protein